MGERFRVVIAQYSNEKGGFFAGAVGTNASNSTFTDNSRIVNITYENLSSKMVETLATLKPVDREGYYVPRCMDGTREYIFQEIDDWLDDASEPNILWLSGSPGAGKSAVASSMVSRLAARRRLGSNFFFRRGDVALSDPAALWRTVAYDLTTRDPDYASAVVEVLKEGRVDPKWPDIDLHFKFLIEEPMMKNYRYSIPPVIVIDALDECDSERSQAAQRKALLKSLVQWSFLPKTFKLVITGRDDRVPESFRTACKRMVLPTGGNVSTDVNDDVRRFFEERFAEVGGSLFPDWPGDRVLRDLVVRAAGLFIWAETIMRMLEQGLPDEQLELILSGDLGSEDNLTGLYCQLLDLSFKGVKGRTLEVYKVVVSTIVLARVPFGYDDLPQFLSQPVASVKFILDKLSSVISVGPLDNRLRIGHLSFSEFLCDRKRCPEAFFIDREKESQEIAMACFERMKEKLKFNICGLETSHLLNDEVENLPEQIAKNIPGSLSYSCRFWAIHLGDTANTKDDHDKLLPEVRDFLEHRFLYWLEVMSFVKEVLTANTALLAAIPWIDVGEFDAKLNHQLINSCYRRPTHSCPPLLEMRADLSSISIFPFQRVSRTSTYQRFHSRPLNL
jgi:NACHT domain